MGRSNSWTLSPARDSHKQRLNGVSRVARTVSNPREIAEFVGAGLAPPAVAPPLAIRLDDNVNRAVFYKSFLRRSGLQPLKNASRAQTYIYKVAWLC